jgi:hypothetical protein
MADLSVGLTDDCWESQSADTLATSSVEMTVLPMVASWVENSDDMLAVCWAWKKAAMTADWSAAWMDG